MANFGGLLRKMNGSVGDLTFKQVKGQTIVSEKVTKVANPRTEPMMRQRMKWTNISAMFSGIRPLLNEGFETKEGMQTDYNKFMQINLAKTPVYLTKQQKAAGACVAAPYQITQGSLQPIAITGEGRNAATNIFIADLTLGASTTVGQFSQAVLANNPSFRSGDQISYFIIKQKIDETSGIPYCQFKANKVELDVKSEVKLWDAVPKNGFSTVDGCVGHSGNDGDCVFAWVHSRKEGGKVKVSSQTLVNANSKLADYQGDVAFNVAALSYGEVKDVFLSPSGSATGAVSGGGTSGNDPLAGGGDSL